MKLIIGLRGIDRQVGDFCLSTGWSVQPDGSWIDRGSGRTVFVGNRWLKVRLGIKSFVDIIGGVGRFLFLALTASWSVAEVRRPGLAISVIGHDFKRYFRPSYFVVRLTMK